MGVLARIGAPTLLGTAVATVAAAAWPLVIAGVGTSFSAATRANLFLATTGSDSCIRSATPITFTTAVTGGNVCLTYDRSYAVAANGDTVAVRDGTFSAPPLDRFIDEARSHAAGAITFKCENRRGNDSVKHLGQHFGIRNADGVTVRGNCFRFQSIWLGEGGDTGARVTGITFDGVHMETFRTSGDTGTTIKNSEVGPSVSCQNPSQFAGVDPRECLNVWPESIGYREDIDLDANGGHGEAQISSNATVTSTGFTFENNYLHDFQGRDTVNFHEGCIQANNDGDLDMLISGNTFERCAVLGILFDVAGGAANDAGYEDVTVQNNFFGNILKPYDVSPFTCCTEAESSQRNLIFKQERTSQAITMENILIRYNTFKHGMTLNHLTTAQSYSSVRVIGNIMGKASTCESGSGLVYDRNVWVKGSRGCGEANFKTVAWDADNPLAMYSEGSAPVQDRLHPVSNFHLGARAYAFENWITEATSDYAITKDIDGLTRTSGSRDAGADERRKAGKRQR